MSWQLHRDAWGIAHLRADSERELAYAQGHAAASDRGWQLEVERHRAQGTSSAFLGGEALSWDRFARQARLADTAQRCFATLDDETRGWVAAYVDGVNAGLTRNGGRPPEFAATGLAVGRWQDWTPLAVWLSRHILFAGFPAKLWREHVATTVGEHAGTLFATDGPSTSGSNGWLIPGDLTATGAALLAGDPHRVVENPGGYQQIHLACPGIDVLGLAMPGVPGIAHFGHTGTVAWAITNAMADYQDLYREQLRRNEGTPQGSGVQARGPDGWEEVALEHTTIAVADAASVLVPLLETARGPIIIGAGAIDVGVTDPDLTDGSRPEAVSLRYPPRVTGRLGFESLLPLLRARTVHDVDHALRHWVEPVNVVLAADTAGGLLHRVAGLVPTRPPANRLRPVPAWESAHRWSGWEPMPRRPVHGVAVMANERGLSAPLGVEFAAAHRADRIRELLAGCAGWTAFDQVSIHGDTYLPSAAFLLTLVRAATELSPAGQRMRHRLLGWDRHMDAASADATAYAWFRSALVRRLAGLPTLHVLADGPGHPELFAPWMALLPRIAFALEPLLRSDLVSSADCRIAVLAALEEVADCQPPPWGEVHRLAPLQAVPDTGLAAWPGVGGDHDCVLSTTAVPGVSDRPARASAARYVWDLADRDNSGWVVPGGSSGLPGNPHQFDQLLHWAHSTIVPVVTDPALLTQESHGEP